MDMLAFIFQRMTDKFVDETESELYKYKRFLEKEIKKGGKKQKEKEALKEVRKALGESTDMVTEVVEQSRPEDDWGARQKKKKEIFKKNFASAIKDHFDTDY